MLKHYYKVPITSIKSEYPYEHNKSYLVVNRYGKHILSPIYSDGHIPKNLK